MIDKHASARGLGDGIDLAFKSMAPTLHIIINSGVDSVNIPHSEC